MDYNPTLKKEKLCIKVCKQKSINSAADTPFIFALCYKKLLYSLKEIQTKHDLNDVAVMYTLWLKFFRKHELVLRKLEGLHQAVSSLYVTTEEVPDQESSLKSETTIPYQLFHTQCRPETTTRAAKGAISHIFILGTRGIS